MSEALFNEAFSLMLAKMLPSYDIEDMRANFESRFPRYPMRDDVGLIAEYAGMGGFDEGFASMGIPTIASVDAWNAANQVRAANQEGEVIQGYIGTEQGQLHPDDLVERYADLSQGRPIHYHASPPCQAFTLAQRRTGPAGKTEEEIYEFMSDKYGEWIVFKPQLNIQNSLLWILPYIVLIFGGFLIFTFFKKRQ